MSSLTGVLHKNRNSHKIGPPTPTTKDAPVSPSIEETTPDDEDEEEEMTHAEVDDVDTG